MNLGCNLNSIFDNSERRKNKRFKIKKTLIDKIGFKLGLDSIDKEIFENFSNTLLRKMLGELEELKELENKD